MGFNKEMECDIAYVLESSDFGILQKFEALCRNFRTTITARIEDANIHDREYTKKRTMVMEKRTQLENKMETVKSKYDKAVVQQKVTDKKIMHLVKKQAELQVQLEKLKAEVENLSLQIVDDEQVLEERKLKKQKTWNAIKLACNVYKETLNIHIKLLSTESDCERVKVSFFTKDERKSDEFHVCLQKQENHWQVEQIQPVLSEEQTNELKSIIDFSKQMTVSDIIAFLCKLRHIFLRYYTNVEY